MSKIDDVKEYYGTIKEDRITARMNVFMWGATFMGSVIIAGYVKVVWFQLLLVLLAVWSIYQTYKWYTIYKEKTGGEGLDIEIK